MADDTLEMIRETARLVLGNVRRQQRDEEADINRRLEHLRLSHKSVVDIAKNLKSKSVTVQELRTLRHSLAQEHNIDIVLSEQGALKGLVRELTGHDSQKQSEAAMCFCNLAMGDKKACEAIVRCAGIYIVALLDSLDAQLCLVGAWTIVNLAGSGYKASAYLTAQGAIPKLVQLMVSGCNADIIKEATRGLIQLTIALRSSLRQEHLTKIMTALFETDITAETARLMFILTCHKNFKVDEVPTKYREKLLSNLSVKIEENFLEISDEVLFTIRIFANLQDAAFYEQLVDYFQENPAIIVRLLESCIAHDSILWLLGNIDKYHEDKMITLINQLS